jgi:hypothetical protein
MEIAKGRAEYYDIIAKYAENFPYFANCFEMAQLSGKSFEELVEECMKTLKEMTVYTDEKDENGRYKTRTIQLEPEVKELFDQFVLERGRRLNIIRGDNEEVVPSSTAVLQFLHLIEYFGGNWHLIDTDIQNYIWKYWQDHGKVADDFIIQTAKYHLKPWYLVMKCLKYNCTS